MSDRTQLVWDHPEPFLMPITVDAAHADRLGHVNNLAYLQWMEDISWAHIDALGIHWEAQERDGKAMAITRTEIDYLLPGVVGDRLLLATWVIEFDGRFRSARRFQLVRLSDGKTLSRALSRHACIDLKTQRPARVPADYATRLQSAVVALADTR